MKCEGRGKREKKVLIAYVVMHEWFNVATNQVDQLKSNPTSLPEGWPFKGVFLHPPLWSIRLRVNAHNTESNSKSIQNSYIMSKYNPIKGKLILSLFSAGTFYFHLLNTGQQYYCILYL